MKTELIIKEMYNLFSRENLELLGVEPDFNFSEENLCDVVSILITKIKECKNHKEHLEQENQYLKRARDEMSNVQALAEAITTTVKLDWIFDLLIFASKKIVEFESCAVLLFEEENTRLEFSREENIDNEIKKIIENNIEEDIINWIIARKQITVLETPLISKTAPGKPINLIVAPLSAPPNSLGVFIIGTVFERESLSQHIINMLSTLMFQASVAIKNAKAYAEVETLSVTDELTQLYNSRYFLQALDREIERSRRYGKPFSLVFIDLDRFKAVNDKHGHLMGSLTLKEVGQVIRETVRHPDIACRYGGDEYVLILPETDNAGGILTADRLREKIAEHTFLEKHNLDVSIRGSFGVSTFPDQAKTKRELVEKADQALYKAKERRGNTVLSGDFNVAEKKARTANNA